MNQGSHHIKATKSASLNQICQTYQHVFQTKSNFKAHLSKVNQTNDDISKKLAVILEMRATIF